MATKRKQNPREPLARIPEARPGWPRPIQLMPAPIAPARRATPAIPGRKGVRAIPAVPPTVATAKRKKGQKVRAL